MSIFDTGKPLKKITKVVPVFLTINNEYAPYAAATIRSLTQHANKKRFYRIIILHDGISLPNRIRLRSLVTRNCALQFKKIDRSIYLRAIIRHCSRKKGAGDFFSSAVYYYRAFIAQLFPIYEKAVYIDSDTILMDDIGKLFDRNKAIDNVKNSKMLNAAKEGLDKGVTVAKEKSVKLKDKAKDFVPKISNKDNHIEEKANEAVKQSQEQTAKDVQEIMNQNDKEEVK